MNGNVGTSTRAMTRERWKYLAPLVDSLLDRPPVERHAYIAAVEAQNGQLAAELSRFVNIDSDGADESLFAAAERERSALMSNQSFDATIDLLSELRASLGASYQIEGEIGGAGMSRVFVAEERELERKVAIKVLPPEFTHRVSADRFAREMKIAASLQQANIVPVLTTGTAAGFPYYTMPFVEGRSLRDRLRRDGPPAIGEAIGILRDVARALAYAHDRGIIHRDIKPGNILLSDRTAVVVDFGIAKAVAAAGHDEDGALGTPAYMAPEQARGNVDVDHRADIFAFGCVAYELVTGQAAFSRATPGDIVVAQLRDSPRSTSELRPDLPDALGSLIASCLEKDPSRRPQSVNEILRSLDRASMLPTTASRRRARRAILAIGAIVAVAFAIVGWSFYNSKHEGAAPAPGTRNAAALDHFLIGQTQFRRRGADVSESIKSFKQAIELDSNFARAHAALANALELEPFFNGAAVAPSTERAIFEARRALALDSTLADAWVALGIAYGYTAQWAASDSMMRRAIQLEPQNAMARQAFGRQLIVRGSANAGLEQLERARADDPTSPLISAWLSYAFYLNGEPDSALAQIGRTIRLDSTLLATANFGALVNLALGRKDEARRVIVAPIAREMTNAPYVYAKLGDTAAANRLIREMEQRTPRPWFVDVAKASVFLASGDSASALNALERSARESGPMWVLFMPLGDPAYDLVRRSPRFVSLLRRANVDLGIVTKPRRGAL